MPDRELIERLGDTLVHDFGVDRCRIRIVFAPYRICPLGAHIDHQLGQVTSMALDRGVWLAYTPLDTPEICMSSLDYPGTVRCHFKHVPDHQDGDWGNYVRGAIRALQQNHQLKTGLIGITAGRVSEGGLSSSAAVGVAYLLALEDVNALQLDVSENILLDQYIENTYLGLRNGILDQSAILLSKRRHLTLVDCADMHHELIPQRASMASFVVLIVFSGVKQALTSTDYNCRVAECTEAAQILLDATGQSAREPFLGNITPAQYATHRSRLAGAPARRAAHFFAESDRVQRGVEAWQLGDLPEFGRLITASGASSIENYECGAPPLIDLYHILIETGGVYGARFSGAGFRGCCLALVDPDRADEVAEEVHQRYAKQYPELKDDAAILICHSGDGAAILNEIS
ncbi:MAG: hypothetical protein JW829_16985 [Pirellulales bacterium]|nr:hypothetical protein [Pirellulales bacterium]